MNKLVKCLWVVCFILHGIQAIGQSADTEAKLLEYKSLYDKGLIEEDEYKKLKNELLFGNEAKPSSSSVDEINIDNVKKSISDRVYRESKGGFKLVSLEKTNTVAHSEVIRELEFKAVVEVAKDCYQQPANAIDGALGQCLKLHTTDQPASALSQSISGNSVLLTKGTRTVFGGKVTIQLSERGWVQSGDFSSYGCQKTVGGSSSSSTTASSTSNANSSGKLDNSSTRRFSCYSSTLFDYAVVEVEVPTKAYDQEQELVYHKILEKIGRADNLRLSGSVDMNKEPEYRIKVEYATVSYTRKAVNYSEYYSCKIKIGFVLLDSNGKEIDRTTGDVETKFHESIMSKAKAFEYALANIYKAIDTPVYHLLPIKAKLTSVYDPNRKGINTRGVIDKGTSVGVVDNCRLEVFHQGRKIGLIHIREIGKDESKGTFSKDGIEEINSLLKLGEQLDCISWY